MPLAQKWDQLQLSCLLFCAGDRVQPNTTSEPRKGLCKWRRTVQRSGSAISHGFSVLNVNRYAPRHKHQIGLPLFMPCLQLADRSRR